jgi:hypothetical protein
MTLWTDADKPFVAKLTDASQRFILAMRDRDYAAIWHEQFSSTGRWSTATHCAGRLVRDLIAAGKDVPANFTELVSLVLQTDMLECRSGLFEGIPGGMEKMGAFGASGATEVIPYPGGYMVIYQTSRPPFAFPVPLIDSPGQPFDIETFLVASGEMLVEPFLRDGIGLMAQRRFGDAITKLEAAVSLKRPHAILRQIGWQQLFNDARRRLWARDATVLPIAESRLDHATHLLALTMQAPIPDNLRITNSVFLSHSSSDNEFCRRLATEMRDLGIRVWYDEWEIKVGDSIRAKIDGGVEEHDFLCVALSPASVASDWVRYELDAATLKGLEEQRVVVLPLLLADCEIPPDLADVRYADFRLDFFFGLRDLIDGLADKA